MTERHVVGAEMPGQRRGQTHPHPAAFAVDDDAADSVVGQIRRGLPGPFDGVRSRRGATVGDDDEQRSSARVAQPFAPHHLGGLHQAFGQRGSPAGG